MLVGVRKLCDIIYGMPHMTKDGRIGGSSYLKPDVEDSTKVLESGIGHQARCLEASST